MQVLELMKTHVIKVRPDVTIRDAVDMMDLYQISGLPVVDDDDRLVGVITEYDVIDSLLPHYARQAPHAPDTGDADLKELVRQVRQKLVSAAMTSPAIAIDEEADVLEAASTMVEKRVKRLPVTAHGKLVGIISRMDICQAILEGQL